MKTTEELRSMTSEERLERLRELRTQSRKAAGDVKNCPKKVFDRLILLEHLVLNIEFIRESSENENRMFAMHAPEEFCDNFLEDDPVFAYLIDKYDSHNTYRTEKTNQLYLRQMKKQEYLKLLEKSKDWFGKQFVKIFGKVEY